MISSKMGYFKVFVVQNDGKNKLEGHKKGTGGITDYPFSPSFHLWKRGGAERSNISDHSSPVHTIMTARSHLTIMAEIEDKPVNHLQRNHSS